MSILQSIESYRENIEKVSNVVEQKFEISDIYEDEYELSIRLMIQETTATEILDLFEIKDRVEFIVYYSDGTRLKNDIIQNKSVLISQNKLRLFYYNKQIYIIPYNLTYAKEYKVSATTNNVAKSFIKRYIFFKTKQMRVCVESDSKGVYYFCAEYEFDYNVFNLIDRTTYNKDVSIFWHTIADFIKYIYPDILFSKMYDAKPLSSGATIPSRVFSNLFETKFKQVALKPKLDGYKGKLWIDIHTREMFILDDMNVHSFAICPLLQKYPGVIFQYEKVKVKEDNVYHIVLTDIIGCYMRRRLYSPTPYDVLTFFHILNINDKDITITIDNTIYPLKTQSILANLTDSKYYIDGYIIALPNTEIKFKTPTMDVVFTNNLPYIDSTVIKDSISTRPTTNTKPNLVYEIIVSVEFINFTKELFKEFIKEKKTLTDTNDLLKYYYKLSKYFKITNYKILRCRKDRLNPSVLSELINTILENYALGRYSERNNTFVSSMLKNIIVID